MMTVEFFLMWLRHLSISADWRLSLLADRLKIARTARPLHRTGYVSRKHRDDRWGQI